MAVLRECGDIGTELKAIYPNQSFAFEDVFRTAAPYRALAQAAPSAVMPEVLVSKAAAPVQIPSGLGVLGALYWHWRRIQRVAGR